MRPTLVLARITMIDARARRESCTWTTTATRTTRLGNSCARMMNVLDYTHTHIRAHIRAHIPHKVPAHWYYTMQDYLAHGRRTHWRVCARCGTCAVLWSGFGARAHAGERAKTLRSAAQRSLYRFACCLHNVQRTVVWPPHGLGVGGGGFRWFTLCTPLAHGLI